jgi:hypothetical protein
VLDKETIFRLYNKDGMSTSEIANRYNTTVWKVISFMRRNKISRRTPAETLKIQFERKPLSFNKKINLNIKDNNLLIFGLSVYWAEGSKTNSHAVDFANSNEKMLIIFLKMLRKIYSVQESRLRVYIYCFANQNPKKLINYWSTKLAIPRDQFSKPYIRKDYKIEKVDRMPNGLVHIRYHDKKLLRQILKDIDIIASGLIN